MKTVLVALLLTSALVALAPTAVAAPSCETVTEAPPPGTGVVYVVPVGTEAQVWTEANSVPGLQRVVCEDANGRRLPPDSYWITLGAGTPFEVVREIEDATGCQIGVPVRCIV